MSPHRKGVRRAPRRRRRGRRPAQLIGVLVAALFAAQSTNATFTAKTSNTANTLTAGTVVITDNDGGSALFTATSLLPGDSATVCTGVSYTGTITSAVIKLYVTSAQESTNGTTYGAWANSTASLMDDNLDMHVEVSSNDLAANPGSSCSPTGVGTFTDVAPAATTMRSMINSNTGYANGLPSQWGTVVPNTWRVWRFTYTFSSGATTAAQNHGVKFAFAWEAQR